jgi:periplasmic divalent cation tolerance protein
VSDVALVHATFADRDEAERIARTLIDERLAACANLLAPCTSFYRWQGVIEAAVETPALFKTTPALAERLRVRITQLHSYDLPVVEIWPVAAGAAVSDWIATETG